MRRGAKEGCFGRGEQGFTLIELTIVLAILSVLSTIALSGFAVFKIRAQEALLKNSVYLVKVETDAWVNDYSRDRRWGGNYDTAFLNGRLEKALEAGAPGSSQGVKNPFSGSRAVINWTDVLLAESSPAIQITNNADYSHAGMGTVAVHPELRGAVVVYLGNGIPTVDIFYVDLLGKRSSMLLTSTAEGGSLATQAAPVTSALPDTPVTPAVPVIPVAPVTLVAPVTNDKNREKRKDQEKDKEKDERKDEEKDKEKDERKNR